MDIVIAAGGMEFGPDTLKYKSLGGSEIAVTQVARELGKLGHKVTIFCKLPGKDSPDHCQSGHIEDKNVIWCHIDGLGPYIQNVYHDLFIISRDPNIASMASQSKKKVLWMHDISTKRGMGKAFGEMAFAIDEVWAVSNWHADQISKGSDYPREFIKPLRNGIVKVETLPMPRQKGTLLYAARPERGLENLVRPGGVMSHLPDYNLKICMYAHFPEHMKDFYEHIQKTIADCPNAEYIGSLTQSELRQLMIESEAYIYPTQFEETSCIIAREAIETRTPFITTRVGALPETLDECGIFFDGKDLEPGSEDWCRAFAEFTKLVLDDDLLLTALKRQQDVRKDLYWDGVAELMIENAQPTAVTPASRLWSLMQDNSIIPALAYYDTLSDELKSHPFVFSLYKELSTYYPFLKRFGEMPVSEYYTQHYSRDEFETYTPLFWIDELKTDRAEYLRASLEGGDHAAPNKVIEIGCGCGHLVATWAKKYPNMEFWGVDPATNAVDFANEKIKENEITNLHITAGDDKNWPVEEQYNQEFDIGICSEVLEHVENPWELLDFIESKVKQGGKMILSVPFGPWERKTTHVKKEHWGVREHIWHFTQNDIRTMLKGKKGFSLVACGCGVEPDNHTIGQYVFEYTVDHNTRCTPLDPLAMAHSHYSRQSCAAAVLAYNNEDTILKMLNSISQSVQLIQIAHGPSTDDTLNIISRWAANNPWTRVRIIDVPKIKSAEFDGDNKVMPETGFSFGQARNRSVDELDVFDWVLWIDTDEFLVGNYRPYLRESCIQSYLISQHHFTVEPRGAPIQIDKPARLFRTRSDFVCRGHIHEHFELRGGGGPGRAIILPAVDIGHTGYENEAVRQERFSRNFPFLVWDHQEEDDMPDEERRNLHPFLWFRDIIHRMRYAEGRGESYLAEQMAKEAEQYYNDNWEKMSAFGPGMVYALGYMAEVYKRLGKGCGFKMAIQLEDGKNVELSGVLKTYEQFERVIGQLMKPEFELHEEKYY